MEKLLIIADDFTGSLDTGVQFAGYDARIKILTRPLYDFSSIERDVSVLVVNANTRHLSPEKAYETVYSIVKGALAAGFSHVYKKVDSGLRGNIGSELAAVMDAASLDNIHFVPSFPKLGRFVSGGRLFIDGKPLTESIFAKDPFNPAHSDSVLDIISSSTDKNVILNSFEGNGIHVYDAVTEEDLEEYPHLRMAEGESDTGVIVSFNTESPASNGSIIVPEGIRTIGINPLNWSTESEFADRSLNAGACFTDYSGSITKEIPNLTGAYLDPERGTLKAVDVDPADYSNSLFPDGVYHLMDYQFFYRNLQENVRVRTDAWLSAS